MPQDDARRLVLLQRNVILAALLVLAAASWIALIRVGGGASGMGGALTMGRGAPLFLAVWVVMMVAMMFPAAAPMVLTFHAVQAAKQHSTSAFLSTWVFVGGDLAVWTLAGLAAYVAATLGEALAARFVLSPPDAARIGGAVLVVAGLYQLTPLKTRCLAKCRTPLAFIMTAWRGGLTGAFSMGVSHGWWCLGCCWLLFVILFPLGIMNAAAMVAVTLFVFAEKTLPRVHSVGVAAALVLVGFGAAVLVSPHLLPTFPMS